MADYNTVITHKKLCQKVNACTIFIYLLKLPITKPLSIVFPYQERQRYQYKTVTKSLPTKHCPTNLNFTYLKQSLGVPLDLYFHLIPTD